MTHRNSTGAKLSCFLIYLIKSLNLTKITFGKVIKGTIKSPGDIRLLQLLLDKDKPLTVFKHANVPFRYS